jgi:hypothetical protein
LDNYIYNFCVMNPHFLKNKFSNETNLLIKAKFDWLALFKEWKNVWDRCNLGLTSFPWEMMIVYLSTLIVHFLKFSCFFNISYVCDILIKFVVLKSWKEELVKSRVTMDWEVSTWQTNKTNNLPSLVGRLWAVPLAQLWTSRPTNFSLSKSVFKCNWIEYQVTKFTQSLKSCTY